MNDLLFLIDRALADGNRIVLTSIGYSGSDSAVLPSTHGIWPISSSFTPKTAPISCSLPQPEQEPRCTAEELLARAG
ncbi:MAG: hypothetical protein GWN99_06870 [Gemmatimonadetes bacterium]|nr:hypothetical protein [Gemmatimonadota bacterium]NIS00785.1 hypothetical protein [Gemmatimonadota bacterium]NIW74837.1 hypothetical protein [Gemmatimonadota bacterium]NIY43183.1 hypothetical protein [Gemmatimonadota bacterium]